MNLLIILQIFVTSFIVSNGEDTVYTIVEPCIRVSEFPIIKKDKILFTYDNYRYVLTYTETRQVHRTRHFGHTETDHYTYGLARLYNQNYHVRIHKYRGDQSIWIIPVTFVRTEYKRMRGFLFTDNEDVIKKLNCKTD